MDTLRKIVIFACGFSLMFILGCSAFMDLITPCYIPQQTKAIIKTYETRTGAQLEPNFVWPYDSLWHADRYIAALAFVQQQRQQTLLHQQQLNADEYALQNSILNQSVAQAKEMQTNIFTPSGTIGSTILPGLGLTLGLMIKRSNMVPKAEHMAALAKAKNGSTPPPNKSPPAAKA